MHRRSLALLLLLLTACGDGFFATTRGIPDFREARARWRLAGIDDYTMLLRRDCYCPWVGPVRVTVRDNVVVARIVVETGQPLAPAIADLYPDVDGLFALLESAIADADLVRATYHHRYGVPVDLRIDWRATVADEEVGYVVTDFAPAP
jgi:hypothetical protein